MAEHPVFPYARWSERLPDLQRQFRSGDPFPHVRLTEFLEPAAAAACERDFPPPAAGDWTHYAHYNVRKLGRADRDAFPDSIRAVVDELQTPRFLAFLGALTGIDGLLADPSLEGAGLHQTEPGGFLRVHADFTMHNHRPRWRRRLNLLLYLNEDWREEWNGVLELWDREMTHAVRRYPPLGNHAVIFATDETSFHGHPLPLRAPGGRTRKSIALYYYTLDAATRPARSTDYRPLPGDGWLERARIWLDVRALDLYSRLKRRYRFSDRIASRLLAALSSLRRRDRR